MVVQNKYLHNSQKKISRSWTKLTFYTFILFLFVIFSHLNPLCGFDYDNTRKEQVIELDSSDYTEMVSWTCEVCKESNLEEKNDFDFYKCKRCGTYK